MYLSFKDRLFRVVAPACGISISAFSFYLSAFIFLKSGAKLLPFFDPTKYFGEKVIKFQKLRTRFDKILANSTLHLHFVTYTCHFFTFTTLLLPFITRFFVRVPSSFFERCVRKLNVSCSLLFIVILSHHRPHSETECQPTRLIHTTNKLHQRKSSPKVQIYLCISKKVRCFEVPYWYYKIELNYW